MEYLIDLTGVQRVSFLWRFPSVPAIASSTSCVCVCAFFSFVFSFAFFMYIYCSQMVFEYALRHTHTCDTSLLLVIQSELQSDLPNIDPARNWINYNNVWLRRAAPTRISNFRAIKSFQGSHNSRRTSADFYWAIERAHWQTNWPTWAPDDNAAQADWPCMQRGTETCKRRSHQRARPVFGCHIGTVICPRLWSIDGLSMDNQSELRSKVRASVTGLVRMRCAGHFCSSDGRKWNRKVVYCVCIRMEHLLFGSNQSEIPTYVVTRA